MAVFNEPTQWDHELGNNADVSTLPDDTSATTGVASLQKLFQVINQTPLEAGGVAPDREDFNALFKILGDSVFYGMNGGLASYNPAYDYVVGRYVVYNNTLYKCIQANGASSTVVAPDSVSPLGSDYWKDIENQDSTSLIPNQTIISELPLTDANLHLKDGALLSGSGAYSEYVDLIAEIYNSGDATTSFCTEVEWQTSNTNYGFCNKFVYDSVANTVRLPKINSEHGALIKSYHSGANWYRIYEDGFCEQGGVGDSGVLAQSALITVNLQVEYLDTNYTVISSLYDGDPNGDHTADITHNTYNLTQQSFLIRYYGANSAEVGRYYFWQTSGYTDISGLQTAPIYEYIVVGTVSKTDIQIDIDNVMADLALKADKDFSNVTAPTQAFKDMSIDWVMPNYNAGISKTWGVDNVAESAGVVIAHDSSQQSTPILITVNNQALFPRGVIASGAYLEVSFWVAKNDTWKVTGGDNSARSLIFFPCKGA